MIATNVGKLLLLNGEPCVKRGAHFQEHCLQRGLSMRFEDTDVISTLNICDAFRVFLLVSGNVGTDSLASRRHKTLFMHTKTAKKMPLAQI